MKTCYFVFGPESSGNRLMARLLIAAGCYGDGDVIQRLDKRIPRNKDKIVLIRSFPHGSRNGNRHWPSIPALSDDMKRHGYNPIAIVMLRDLKAMVRSQVRANHVLDTNEAMLNCIRALQTIFCGLEEARIYYIPVNYESLVQQKMGLIEWLFPLIGLPVLKELPEELYDGNEKWYK